MARPKITQQPRITTISRSLAEEVQGELIIPLSTWVPAATSSVFTIAGTDAFGQVSGYSFDPAATEYAFGGGTIPGSWTGDLRFSLLVSNSTGAASADARMGYRMRQADIGDGSIDAGMVGQTEDFTIGGTQWDLEELTFATDVARPTKAVTWFSVVREGAHANDTYTADLLVIALKITAV